jgi:hypothetical protein
MHNFFDSFWRAVAYCLHPRVVLWSLLPLLLAGGSVALLGYAYWESAVDGVRRAMEQWALITAALDWLDSIGANRLRAVLAPMVVVGQSVPVVVVVTLLLVAVLLTPAVVHTVAVRRFPLLEKRQGASGWQSLAWSAGCTLAALAALVLSVPLWFVPPLVLVLPPLIWGWLTCRVFAFDVLAAHATPAERRFILRHRRWPLLGMGLACGVFGALPTLVWAGGAAALMLAPVLVLVSVWLYTLVFSFAACWFAHYALAELQVLRSAQTHAHAAVVPLPSADSAAPLPLSAPEPPSA